MMLFVKAAEGDDI